MPNIPYYGDDRDLDHEDWEDFDRAIRSDAPLAVLSDDPDDPEAYDPD